MRCCCTPDMSAGWKKRAGSGLLQKQVVRRGMRDVQYLVQRGAIRVLFRMHACMCGIRFIVPRPLLKGRAQTLSC